jgi:hypothetical protein
MMTLNDRQPIIVADTGPLIRLAAAGLLDSIRGLNRRIVIVDRVEAEATADLSKPFADTIKLWLEDMGNSIERVQTLVGTGIRALESDARTPEQDRLLKKAMRNSGEMALREFAETWEPTETSSAIVVYEDKRVPTFFTEVEYPVTVMTTRRFANVLTKWGINVNARAALDAIEDQFSLQPAKLADYPAEQPPDTRMLPQEDEGP